MLTCDEYIVSLGEAFAAIENDRGRSRIVAGATDTLPWVREGRAGDVHFPALIDVSKIPELNERQVDDRRVRLGAATPIQRFLDDPVLGRALPEMARCAVWFADDQTRAQATVDGNIVNASPAADATPCFIARNAAVDLASRHGRRRLPLKAAHDHGGLAVIHVPVYCGPDELGGLGAWGEWNVGNWCEDVQRVWQRQDI